MRIKSEQLELELTKNLLPVYLVSGDEPLLVQEALDSIRSHCRRAGFDERKIFDVDRYFHWNTLLEDSNNLSLFAEKKLAEVRLGKHKPGTDGALVIQKYCSSLPDDQILILSAAKLDSSTLKSKWATTIDKVGAIIQIWPIDLSHMPAWLTQRAKRLGLKIEPEAITLLADRLEGNLLAAAQELEKLKLLQGNNPIDYQMVLAAVADSAKYDIFNLGDACLAKDPKLVSRILTNLRLEGQEAAVTLWALSKELRIVLALTHAQQKGLPTQAIFTRFRVIPNKQALLSQAAKRHSQRYLATLLDRCKYVDDLIKGIEKGPSPWDVLLDIALGLTGTAVAEVN